MSQKKQTKSNDKAVVEKNTNVVNKTTVASTPKPKKLTVTELLAKIESLETANAVKQATIDTLSKDLRLVDASASFYKKSFETEKAKPWYIKVFN